MIEVEPQALEIRPFHLLDREWAILVGGRTRPNPMTVSWGGMGTLWNRHVVTVYVRPTRHTFDCLTAHPEFTLNFLDSSQKSALDLCGTHSGREKDKWQLASLEPEPGERVLVPRVKGARLGFECRILSHIDFDPSLFRDASIEKLYPLKDYHRAYFGEVLGIFRAESLGS